MNRERPIRSQSSMHTPLMIESKSLYRVQEVKRKKYQIHIRKNKSPISQINQFIKSPPAVKKLELPKEDFNNDSALICTLQTRVDQLLNERQEHIKQIQFYKQKLEETELNLQYQRQNNHQEFEQINKRRDTQLIDQLRLHIQSLQSQLAEKNKPILNKEIPIITNVEYLESIKLQLERLSQCKYCHKNVRDPVTVIPCAHSYCKQCKKGYTTQCIVCQNETKIEAVYENHFLTTLVDLYQSVINLIKYKL